MSETEIKPGLRVTGHRVINFRLVGSGRDGSQVSVSDPVFDPVLSFYRARRSYASAVLGVVILSVRPSVCPSVTRVLCD